MTDLIKRLLRGFTHSAVLLAFVAVSAPTWADRSPPTPGVPPKSEQKGFKSGVVAVSNPIAAEVGAKVLEEGGNAVDAAAAIQFALNVVEPESSGIGGGGFMMIHLAKSGQTFFIDSREKAPAAATADMFGALSFADASTSGISVGVPGTLRGVATALERWGTIRLAKAIKPAIELAEDGFKVGPLLAADIVDTTDRGFSMTNLQPETAAIFRPGGIPLKEGDLLVQPDLARTLKLIARHGPDVFYKGEIGQAVVAAARSRSRTQPNAIGLGRIAVSDLAAYDVKIRQPIMGHYRGYTIASMPPPSSGGLTVIQMLEMLERFPMGDEKKGFGFGQKNTLHVMIEAMRLAFADRAFWEGDNDIVHVPVKGLLDPTYLARRSAMIDLATVLPPTTHGDPLPFDTAALTSRRVKLAAITAPREATHTTHFVVVDKRGNIVSYTTTVESLFGSGITVPGYGFILNNELTDFNFPPTADATTGNPGANDVAPLKRPRSSMAPTLLLKDGKPFAAMGAAGGATIINSLLQITANIVDHGMTIQQAIDAPRISSTHSSSVSCEIGPFFPLPFTPTPPFATSVIDALRAMGHDIPPCSTNISTGASSSAQAVVIDLRTGKAYGAADPRREGTVIGVRHGRHGDDGDDD